MGGLRRRKEGTIAVAFDLPGLDSVDGIRRGLSTPAAPGAAPPARGGRRATSK